MVMARRPEVKTAAAPVVAIDTVLLAQQMAAALARVPFRRPSRGGSTRLSNLGAAVTRETVRSFMGYMTSLPIPEFRSMELLIDELCGAVMPPVVRRFDVKSRRTELGGVPGIFYRPRREPPRGVVLYLHGGGYIGTSPAMYAFFTARLCHETGCAVFVADYRLAPEFPFPAGVEDAAAVSRALVERGIPPERVFMAGDSGGGGLANTLLLAAPSHVDVVRPAGLILFSPEVDLRLDEASVTDNAEYDILPWNIPTASYLHGFDASSAYVSPVDADLAGFPPTCMSWGADEMFRDPIRRFADRLRRAGVPTHAHEAPGMFHVFQILMPWTDASRDVHRHVGRFVDGILEHAPALDGSTFAALYP
jgi:epsilon-lactone hydrolase